jgi:hypothetical protein
MEPIDSCAIIANETGVVSERRGVSRDSHLDDPMNNDLTVSVALKQA